MKLLPRFLTLIQQWRPCFADYRTHRRAVGFALSLLVCLGRRTISRAICAQQRQFQSWASDYKLFSLSRWNPRSLFGVVLKLALGLVSKTQPVVIALDDTITRKTGRRIPNASTLRDPLSPPYHTNLVWALRFIQAVLLSRLAERTVLIGRTRKDIHLSALPEAQSGRGRRPVYGKDLGTPEQMRKDDSIPWQRATIFAAGRSHQLRYKSVGPVLWRRGAQRRPLRLIIIAPLAYHAHGHRLYRHPAYLLVTDPTADMVQVLQAYFYRWEVEVDQKDEKDLLGVGQAQVWSKQAVSHQPAFHVASYAMLLLAAIQCFGLNSTTALSRLPHWRIPKPPLRLSAAQLIARLRSELELLDTSHSSFRRRPSSDFPRAALEKQIGMQIPVTIR